MTQLEPICVDNLLKLGRAFAQHRGIGMPTVGRYIHGTAHFFEKLEAGSITLTLSTYDKMIARFKKQWPEGAPMPKIREPMRPRRKA